jgi:hypothetical protein
LFSDIETKLENIFDKSSLTYLVTGYSGNYCFSKEPAYNIALPFKPELIEKGHLSFIRHSTVRVQWNKFKHFIKKIIKEMIGVNNINKLRRLNTYISWIMFKKKAPVHTYYKWKVMKKLKKDHNINTFVETGTAGGTTTREMSKHFKNVYSIELNPTFYYRAKGTLEERKNVKILLGDSGEKLKEVLSRLEKPTLFWLDAHYSGGDTALGDKQTPIEKELKSIFNHKIKDHVILIDDARCFNGKNDYPTIDKLKRTIDENGQWKMKMDIDLIIVEPINKINDKNSN